MPCICLLLCGCSHRAIGLVTAIVLAHGLCHFVRVLLAGGLVLLPGVEEGELEPPLQPGLLGGGVEHLLVAATLGVVWPRATHHHQITDIRTTVMRTL